MKIVAIDYGDGDLVSFESPGFLEMRLELDDGQLVEISSTMDEDDHAVLNIVGSADVNVMPTTEHERINVSKPHLGRIANWRQSYMGPDEDFVIRGIFLDHPDYAGTQGHTSAVLRRVGDEIETRNSRYTLVHKG